MYAAWQADLTPTSPYIEAQLPDGTWKRVMDEMGFPAGLPRTVVVDLTGKLPANTRRIRLVTNLQIYWTRHWSTTERRRHNGFARRNCRWHPRSSRSVDTRNRLTVRRPAT